MADEVNRRSFLKAAAIAAGPAVISARGASEKINIGWIGVGTRGNAAIEWLHTGEPNTVQITAICDTYDGYIARAKDRVKTIWGNTPDGLDPILGPRDEAIVGVADGCDLDGVGLAGMEPFDGCVAAGADADPPDVDLFR